MTPEWPRHAASMTIQHNDHKNNYLSVAEWIDDDESMPCRHKWPSPDAKQRAIDTDELWTIQWYPLTPISFNLVAAPTLRKRWHWRRSTTNDVTRKAAQMTPVMRVHRVESADGIPDGTYGGTWCGNVVNFCTPYGDYEGSTGPTYVKGDMECTVVVSTGKVSVEVCVRR